jgi:hypothetical protein
VGASSDSELVRIKLLEERLASIRLALRYTKARPDVASALARNLEVVVAELVAVRQRLSVAG